VYTSGTPCELRFVGCVDWFSEKKDEIEESAHQVWQEACYMHENVKRALDGGQKFIMMARNSWCGNGYSFNKIPAFIEDKMRRNATTCGTCCVMQPEFACGKEIFMEKDGFVETFSVYEIHDPCTSTDGSAANNCSRCVPPDLPAQKTSFVSFYGEGSLSSPSSSSFFNVSFIAKMLTIGPCLLFLFYLCIIAYTSRVDYNVRFISRHFPNKIIESGSVLPEQAGNRSSMMSSTLSSLFSILPTQRLTLLYKKAVENFCGFTLHESDLFKKIERSPSFTDLKQFLPASLMKGVSGHISASTTRVRHPRRIMEMHRKSMMAKGRGGVSVLQKRNSSSSNRSSIRMNDRRRRESSSSLDEQGRQGPNQNHCAMVSIKRVSIGMLIIGLVVGAFVRQPFACSQSRNILNMFRKISFSCEKIRVPISSLKPRAAHVFENPFADVQYLGNGVAKIHHQIIDYGITEAGQVLIPPELKSFVGSCAKMAGEGTWKHMTWNMARGRAEVQRAVKDIGWNVVEFMDLFDETPYDNYRYNIIRVAVMWLHGGLYTDLDMLCLKSPEHLIDDIKYGFFMGTTKKIEGAIFAARPRHPFVRRVFEVQRGTLRSLRIFQHPFGTGPIAFKRAYTSYHNSWDTEGEDRGKHTQLPSIKLLTEDNIDVSARMDGFMLENYARRNQVTIVHVHASHWGWKFIRANLLFAERLLAIGGILGLLYLYAWQPDSIIRITINRTFYNAQFNVVVPQRVSSGGETKRALSNRLTKRNL